MDCPRGEPLPGETVMVRITSLILAALGALAGMVYVEGHYIVGGAPTDRAAYAILAGIIVCTVAVWVLGRKISDRTDTHTDQNSPNIRS